MLRAAIAAAVCVLAACSPCSLWSRNCQLTDRADGLLKCPNLVNGGLHQSATIRHETTVADGERYLICCGGTRYRDRCVSFFCPTGQSTKACVRD